MDHSPQPSLNNNKQQKEKQEQDSPQLQESPFSKFVCNLSPIQPMKSRHVTQSLFVGLNNSPPPVFTSPRIASHPRSQFTTHSLVAESDTGIATENDATTQDCSSHLQTCFDQYLADHLDIDFKQSRGGEDVNGEDDNDNNHEDEKNDVGKASQECANFDFVLETRDSHDSRAQLQCTGSDQILESKPEAVQNDKECEDCEDNVLASNASTENISEDGSEASLKHHGGLGRCLQFGEATTGSNNSHANLNANSSKMKMAKLSEPAVSLFREQCSGTANASGIELHLNSSINAMPPGCAATNVMRLVDGIQGMKSISLISSPKTDDVKRSLIASNMDGQSSINTGKESHEIDASKAADSFISESLSIAELTSVNPESVHDKRKLSATDAGNSEKIKRSSRSKKNYCDCFNAGIYCSGPCSCQGCLNSQEHEETVLEARRQIGSRNPLAFLPKVVQHTTNMEDANLTTPSSARHKRGCNCRRLKLDAPADVDVRDVGMPMAGKKNVGSSNTYLLISEYVPIQHALSKERVVEKGSGSTFDDKLDKVVSKTVLYDLHHLSPITPSLQCSDQGKEAAKSRFLSAKHLPSPDSAGVNMTPYRPEYTNKTGSYRRQMDQLSRKHNSLQHTPVSLSLSAKTKKWADIPKWRLSHGPISHLSSSSLRRRSSPNIPSTRIGETQCVDQSLNIAEDETPDILKEVSTPTNPVKANSPNQKRVSPPHGHSHLHALGDGFRSGRGTLSFTPFTTCTDSKGNGNEDLGNSSSK
ncbi:unnamed protein product [Lupinus luteus]|uniref:CRC domain-containing protein n=1 Tax=Lupinus luteus TaxID=3873 RepID=A0AAV1XN25_LUPLU